MQSIRTRLIILVAALGTVSGLAGCAAVAVGGAAAATALVATNRRSPATQLADQTIELDAASAVRDLMEGRGHVSIVSYYRKVLLTGEVPTEDDRRRVHETVTQIAEVEGVINELAVMPDSSLTSRSNDTLVTGRVKTNLLSTDGVPANSIKIVTTRGDTYLMGRLTRREADLATEAARTTSGVQRVVRVIDFITEQAALHPADADKGNTGQAPAPVSTIDADGDKDAEAVPRGAVTHPVSQPVMVQQPPIQVEQLPPSD